MRPFLRPTLTVVTAVVALALLAPCPARAEWLSLFQGSMLFDEGEWDPNIGYRAGGALAIASADFDGDGHQDIVVPNTVRGAADGVLQSGTTVSVLFHTSPSGYRPPISFWSQIYRGPSPALEVWSNYATGSQPVEVGAADINGDGRPDIVVSLSGSTPGISVLLNTGASGSARFDPPKTYPLPGAIRMMVGDVDGDGTPEVLAADAVSPATTLKTYRWSGSDLVLVGTSSVPGDALVDRMALADVTGDGIKDVVVAKWGVDCDTDTGVFVLPGTNAGTFGAALGPFPTPHEVGMVAVANVNGDAYPDVVASTLCTSEVCVFQGAPAGQLNGPLTISLPHIPRTLSVGDLDGDTKADIVTTAASYFGLVEGSVCVVKGNGNGTFSAPALAAGPVSSYSSILADINEDGRPDLVTPKTGTFNFGSEPLNHTVEILLNDGAGGFQAPSVSGLGTPHCYKQAVGDFNRDGMPDVASADAGLVMIGLGNGTGLFTGLTSFSVATPSTLITGDLDRDGKLDLLVQSGSSVEQWQGNGNGTFTFSTSYPSLTIYPRSLADMTGDGMPDLLAHDGSNMVVRAMGAGGFFLSTIVVGSPTVGNAAALSGDWNRDGLQDVAVAGANGIAVFLRTGASSFGAQSALRTGRNYSDLCAGDFNRDGVPDLAARENGTALPINRGIDVYRGTGGGSFASSVSYGTMDATGYSLNTWDANLDGIPDLITSSQVPSTRGATVDVHIGDGLGAFGLRTSYGLGAVDRYPSATPSKTDIVPADVDRDGMPDIVSGRLWTSNESVVQTLRARPPASTATLHETAYYSTISGPRDVAVGDLDRDGKLDVVVGTVDTAPGIAVHRGSGGGSIGASQPIALSNYTNFVRLADLNRDGILDIVSANKEMGAPRVSTMMGLGNLAFGPRADYFMNVGNDIEVVDFNRDGILDVVVATPDSVRVLNGTLAGGLVPALGGFPMGAGIFDVDLADLNRDGLLDIVCAKGTVLVSFSNPGGSWAAPVAVGSLAGCQDVCIADVNRDGFLDIVANQADDYFVFWGAASAPYSTYQLSTLGYPVYDMKVGPMAANGVPYLVVTSSPATLKMVDMSPNGVLTTSATYNINNTPEHFDLVDMDRDGLLDVVAIGSGNPYVTINLRGSGTVTGVEAQEAPAPRAVELDQNYPNPFNPETRIRFSLPSAKKVRLTVHDAQGRLVAVLADRQLAAGQHEVPWLGKNSEGHSVGSGVYFYRLATGDGAVRSKRMVLVK